MRDRSAATFDGVDYAPGRRFRVVREGLRLDGWVASRHPGASDGWTQELHPGDILTCTGYGPGSGGDPGYGVEFTSEQSEAAGAFHCDIWPMHGDVFSYRPPPGFLEPVTEVGGEVQPDE